MRIAVLAILLALDGAFVYVAARFHRLSLQAMEASAQNMWLRARAYVSALVFSFIIVPLGTAVPILANKYVVALEPTKDVIGVLFVVGAAIAFAATAAALELFNRR